MAAPITSVSIPAISPPSLSGPGAQGGAGFHELLAGAIRQVEQSGADARLSTERFLAGENEEVHQVVLATQKAELAFELFMQVRNKVVQAYQEVMRMQL